MNNCFLWHGDGRQRMDVRDGQKMQVRAVRRRDGFWVMGHAVSLVTLRFFIVCS
jgi:hypothetical protein